MFEHNGGPWPRRTTAAGIVIFDVNRVFVRRLEHGTVTYRRDPFFS